MSTLFLADNNLSVDTSTHIIDTGSTETATIILEENVEVFYTFAGTAPIENIKRHIIIKKNAKFSGSAVITNSIHGTFTIETEWDEASSHLRLLALAVTDRYISLEWIALVKKPYRKIFTRVDQTNILIGKTAKIRGVPKLEIATEDIEWGHSCKIHRLQGDALFYLESRWLDTASAEQFLLNSEILRHLDTLPTDQKEHFCSEIHRTLATTAKDLQ